MWSCYSNSYNQKQLENDLDCELKEIKVLKRTFMKDAIFQNDLSVTYFIGNLKIAFLIYKTVFDLCNSVAVLLTDWKLALW